MPKGPAPATRLDDTSSSTERRRNRRIDLTLALAVPVTISTHQGRQRGLARNVSEGGMLIELEDPPPISARVDIFFDGIKRSVDSPEGVTLHGEVRHHVSWQYQSSNKQRILKGIGIRFIDEPVDSLPLKHWAWQTGHTIH